MKKTPRATKKSILSINKISNTSVEKATQKSWSEWIDILNRAGAQSLSHREIVRILAQKHRLSLWWQQMVTNAYEIYIGRRIEGQNQKGLYSLTVTKTLPVDAKKYWQWLLSTEGINHWLKPLSPVAINPGQEYEVRGEIFGQIRTVKPQKSIRLRWQDAEWPKPTTVQLLVVARSKGKCLFAITHDGLASSAIKTKMRHHWRGIVDSIKI